MLPLATEATESFVQRSDTDTQQPVAVLVPFEMRERVSSGVRLGGLGLAKAPCKRDKN